MTHNSGTVSFPVYVKIQKMQLSFLLPRMKKPHAHNGNVTRNRGGNRLEGKHTLMFVKLLSIFSSEMHMKLAGIKIEPKYSDR